MKVVLVAALAAFVVVSGADFRGRWKEDQTKRTGLNDLLVAAGNGTALFIYLFIYLFNFAFLLIIEGTTEKLL
jgi:hypothetical protein